MYWAKKIIEWSLTYRQAFQILMELNNTYAIDGRDPNTYAGIAWCFGRHDRGWPERIIFGKLRYMNASGLKRKFNIDQYVDENGQTVYPGYIPRPSDQRVNVGIFFQDYFPGNPDYRMQLQVNFGSGMPFGQPSSPRYMATHHMKSYQRVDIGFSKILKREGKTYPKGHILHAVKDAWISAEVFNLMDRLNSVSYEWVKDYSGKEYAVENSLTRRRFNIKLTAQF